MYETRNETVRPQRQPGRAVPPPGPVIGRGQLLGLRARRSQTSGCGEGQVSFTHWPVALRPTVLGEPAESPTCAAGELPWQLRFHLTVLVTTSFPSGSNVRLSLKLTLRATVLRMNPSQQVRSPVTEALRPMVLSS